MELFGLLFGLALLAIAAVVALLIFGVVYLETFGNPERRGP